MVFCFVTLDTTYLKGCYALDCFFQKQTKRTHVPGNSQIARWTENVQKFYSLKYPKERNKVLGVPKISSLWFQANCRLSYKGLEKQEVCAGNWIEAVA